MHALLQVHVFSGLVPEIRWARLVLGMEEASGGQSELGQTYLPGTASLVQEIDSESK